MIYITNVLMKQKWPVWIMTDKRPTDVFNIQLLSNIKPHYSHLDIAQGQLAATAVYSVAVCWMCSILVFNKKIICNHTNNNIMSQKIAVCIQIYIYTML